MKTISKKKCAYNLWMNVDLLESRRNCGKITVGRTQNIMGILFLLMMKGFPFISLSKLKWPIDSAKPLKFDQIGFLFLRLLLLHFYVVEIFSFISTWLYIFLHFFYTIIGLLVVHYVICYHILLFVTIYCSSNNIKMRLKYAFANVNVISCE